MSTSEITIEQGHDNVYADLGYAEAAEMQRNSTLAAEIARCIRARRLSQSEAAELLGIDQGKISRIARGLFRRVSEQRMLELVVKLGHDVRIVVGPVDRNKVPGVIRLGFPSLLDGKGGPDVCDGELRNAAVTRQTSAPRRATVSDVNQTK